MEKQILFTEVQKFRQWWLWILLILAILPPIGMLIYQLVTGRPISNTSLFTSDILFLGLSLFISAPLLWCVYAIKLFTVIDTDTISYGFRFFGKKLNEIALADVEEMEVVPYKSYSTGMHFSYTYGKVYNASRGMGLFVTQYGGSKVLIGTQKPDELKAAVAKMSKRA